MGSYMRLFYCMLYSSAKSFIFWSLSEACITIHYTRTLCTLALSPQHQSCYYLRPQKLSAPNRLLSNDDSVGCAKSIRPAHSNQSSLVISSLSNHCSIIWVDNISLPILWASAIALLLVQPWVLPTSVQPFNCCQDCMPSISVWFHLVMLFWDHVLHAHQLYNAISAAASNLWLDFDWLLHLPWV